MERKRKRFRWLRRLLKRFRYRRIRAEDGKLADRTKDVEKWQEQQPLMRADYLEFRWKVLSRKRFSKNKQFTAPEEDTCIKEFKDQSSEVKNTKQNIAQANISRKQDGQSPKKKTKSDIHQLEDQLESLKLHKVEKGSKVQMADGSEKNITIYRAFDQKEADRSVKFDVEDNDKNHLKVLETKVEGKKKKKKKKKRKEPCQKTCRYYSLLNDDVDEDDNLPPEMMHPKKKKVPTATLR